MWQLQGKCFQELSHSGAKSWVLFPGSLFCAVVVESSRSLLSFNSSSEYALIIPQPMSTPSSPVSTFLLRPAPRTRSCLTLMDDSSSLRAQHAIWRAILTDRGMEGQFANADFWSIQCGKTFIKRSVPFFFSCLLVILSVRCCQGRRGVDHTLFL